MPDACPGLSARSTSFCLRKIPDEYRYLVSGAVLFSPGPGVASDHPSTRSTIQMLPSGWITRWSSPGLCKPITPCNRRQDFCCAGKIDCSPILIIRDAKIINMTATYGAAEMVIAVRPCGVLRIKT